MENFRCDVEGCLRQSPCEECSLYGVYSSQPPSAEAIRDATRDGKRYSYKLTYKTARGLEQTHYFIDGNEAKKFAEMLDVSWDIVHGDYGEYTPLAPFNAKTDTESVTNLD